MKEFAQKPSAIAYYLHALACHELAHVEAGLSEGHGEEYVAKRENLGETTASLLGPIEEAVMQILKLSRKAPSEADKRKRCEERLARCQGGGAARAAAKAEARAKVAAAEQKLQSLPVDDATRTRLLPVLQRRRAVLIEMLTDKEAP